MKRTKLFVCLVAAFSALSISATAGTNVELNGNSITVTADGYAGKWGTLVVVKSDNTLENANIVAMKQALAGNDGKMTFTFALNDELGESVNGKYDLYIKKGSDALSSVPEDMYYARVDDRNRIIENIKSAANADELIAVLETPEDRDTLKAMRFVIDEYDAIKAQDDQLMTYRKTIADMFLECKSTFADSEIIGALNTAVNIEKINLSSQGATDISEAVENLGFSFEGTAYGDITDAAQKQFIDSYMLSGKYTTISGAEKAYETANILYTINTTRFDELENKLETYASSLGITQSNEYINYRNATNKATVNTAIAESLKKNPTTTVSVLLDVISTAVNGNPVDKPPTGGGNGGGGGGSSSGTITAMPIVSSKTAFEDLDSVSWAQTAINALAEKGIVSGDENGKFNPNAPIKREEFAKMLIMAAGMYSETAECSFEDVAPGAWYYRYVASAFKNGIAYGVSDTMLGVNTQITRQDMAVMCYRAAGKIKTIPAVRDAVEFADGGSISEYAQEAVTALYKANVINGMGENEFVPLGTATRAQAAVMIYNLLIK